MNHAGRVLMAECDERYGPDCADGGMVDDAEEHRLRAIRALEYERICNEQRSLGKGLICGGIISVYLWFVLGVMLAHLLKS